MAIIVCRSAGTGVEDEEVILRKGALGDPVMQEILVRVVCVLSMIRIIA